MRKHLFLGLTSLMLPAFINTAFAGGIYIPLSSVSDLSVARAGGAAAAMDASTNFLNPGAITRFHNPQLVLGAVGVLANTRFTGTMTSPGALGLSPIAQRGSAFSNSNGVVPSFHYVLPVVNNWTAALSVVSPFGLGHFYPSDSILRYDLIYVKANSIDISPSVAYQFTPYFSLGGGPDALYFSFAQKNAVRTQPFTTADSMLQNKANGWNYGWHLGALYQFTPHTRLGLAYRSKIIADLEGNSKFFVEGGTFLLPTSVNNIYNFKIKIPIASLTTLSLYQDVTPCWALMGTVEFGNWNLYRYDQIYNIAAPITGSRNSITVRKLQNTLMYALGTTYQLNPQWLLRAGINYAEGSTTNTYRDIYIPDPSFWGVGIGAHYQVTNCLGWDVAYSHAFIENVKINHTTPVTFTTITGREKFNGDSLSLQMVWGIDKV